MSPSWGNSRQGNGVGSTHISGHPDHGQCCTGLCQQTDRDLPCMYCTFYTIIIPALGSWTHRPPRRCPTQPLLTVALTLLALSSPTSSSGTASLFFSTNPPHWYSTWWEMRPVPALACCFPTWFGAGLCLDTAFGRSPCRSQSWWWPRCPAPALLQGTIAARVSIFSPPAKELQPST